MGQKVNPVGFRLGINRGWDSVWYAKKKDFGNYLIEDFKIRDYIKKNVVNSGVSKVMIERTSNKCYVTIYTSRPGFVIGKKGSEALQKTCKITAVHDGVLDELTYENAGKVAQQIMDQFSEASFDEVVLVYNRFKNAATQIVEVEPYLPIVVSSTEVETASADYIFEPSKAEIVNDLLPKSLKMQLYKAIRDSFASEHGARMTAMHKATDNAKELRDQLKLTYNKARQAAITNEILEIVGGAEALNG